MIQPVAPAAHVRRNVLQFAKSNGETRAYIQRDDPAVWKSLPIPGLSIRLLYVDHQRKTQTIMLRAEPGAVLPPHEHSAAEECYVLEGELETLGTVFKAGDFFRAAPGTSHGESRSPTGCTVLITSAIDEEFAAAWQ
jgi:anti-sigma factor ChrR (cupin superfamily)